MASTGSSAAAGSSMVSDFSETSGALVPEVWAISSAATKSSKKHGLVTAALTPGGTGSITAAEVITTRGAMPRTAASRRAPASSLASLGGTSRKSTSKAPDSAFDNSSMVVAWQAHPTSNKRPAVWAPTRRSSSTTKTRQG